MKTAEEILNRYYKSTKENAIIAMEEYLQQQLITLGKEILKHQEEMLLYNSMRSSAVPISAIIKAFDNLGIKIEDKIDF